MRLRLVKKKRVRGLLGLLGGFRTCSWCASSKTELGEDLQPCQQLWLHHAEKIFTSFCFIYAHLQFGSCNLEAAFLYTIENTQRVYQPNGSQLRKRRSSNLSGVFKYKHFLEFLVLCGKYVVYHTFST